MTSRLHVVMLCEDADAAQCGEGVYQTLVGQLGEGFDLDLHAWRFSELAPLNLRLAAAWQAAKANLILIACQGIRALPRAVQGWLDLWVGRQSNCELVGLPPPWSVVTIIAVWLERDGLAATASKTRPIWPSMWRTALL